MLREKVTPRDEIGCKRIMLTDEWYPTLTQPNVELVTDRIERDHAERACGPPTATERPADVLVFGTGFKSHAFVAPMEIVGRGGRTLAEAWSGVPKAYLGLTVSGFPNMFLLYGPNTNGGTGLGHLHGRGRRAARHRGDPGAGAHGGAQTIELRPEAAEAFDRELREALAGSVWHTGCTSWYVDEEGNDPNQWPWLWSTYRRRTSSLDPAAYQLA